MDRPWRSSRNAPASNVGYGESLIGETQDSATAKAKGNAFERYSYVSRQSEGPPAELTLRGPQEELLSLAREKVSTRPRTMDAH